ncbi:MAG: tRNA 2-thiouridine(34) synthase MnmA [Gammaproteobacteria bacterium]|nr:tRNA 2-thiouridine(34) synthase MnmA [Gammaproteobacteria bacterium]
MVTTAEAIHDDTVVALSGGVDSSVTAMLLQQQGHRLQGLFMKNWEGDDRPGYCAAEADVADALAVCEQLGIPLNTVNLSKAYWDEVFTRFLAEYAAGNTPNPDVLCNQSIKFNAFVEHVLELGADRVATGHYARIDRRGGRYRLLKGVDLNKDQSYFLCRLGQPQLARTLFPLGELTKPEVRRLAADAGFITHDKKDSTGICFIGERPFRDFLGAYLSPRPGEIHTPDGRVIGEHDGVMFYTIGQRQGLNIGGVRGADEAPWYVLDKDPENNVLIVGQGHNHPLLYAPALLAAEVHWVAGDVPRLPLECTAKIRYRQPDQPCSVTGHAEGIRVTFDAPQRAITPGQYVVLYNDDECLGSACITAIERGRQ